MTANRARKQQIRTRMAETGEQYSVAARSVESVNSESDRLRRGYSALMALADRLPHRIAYPLIAACVRVPLGTASTSLFLLGPAQTGKSGAARMVSQMWTAKAGEHGEPLLEFMTGPALERFIYEGKTPVLVFEELSPRRCVEVVLHVMGPPRRRATKDLRTEVRTDVRPPLLILTGREAPDHEAVDRRTVYVRLNAGDVAADALAALTPAELVAARRELALSLSHRVAAAARSNESLARQRDAYAESLADGWNDTGAPVSARPVAELAVGLRMFLDLVLEAGVLTRMEAERRWQQAWPALRDTIATQIQVATERVLWRGSPGQRVWSALTAALVAHPDRYVTREQYLLDEAELANTIDGFLLTGDAAGAGDVAVLASKLPEITSAKGVDQLRAGLRELASAGVLVRNETNGTKLRRQIRVGTRRASVYVFRFDQAEQQGYIAISSAHARPGLHSPE